MKNTLKAIGTVLLIPIGVFWFMSTFVMCVPLSFVILGFMYKKDYDYASIYKLKLSYSEREILLAELERVNNNYVKLFLILSVVFMFVFYYFAFTGEFN